MLNKKFCGPVFELVPVRGSGKIRMRSSFEGSVNYCSTTTRENWEGGEFFCSDFHVHDFSLCSTAVPVSGE